MQTIHCGKCGALTEAPAGAETPRFCGSCGTPLGEGAPSPSDAPPSAIPLVFPAGAAPVKPDSYFTGEAPATFMGKINGAPLSRQRRDTRWAPSFEIRFNKYGLWVTGKHRQTGKAVGIALALTVASVVLVFFMRSMSGFGCAPGFLIWFVIADLITRKAVNVPVDTSHLRAAFDPNTRRFSLEVLPGRWLTFRLSDPAMMNGAMHALLARYYGPRLMQGDLKLLSTGQKVGMSICFGLLGALILFGVVMAAIHA